MEVFIFVCVSFLLFLFYDFLVVFLGGKSNCTSHIYECPNQVPEDLSTTTENQKDANEKTRGGMIGCFLLLHDYNLLLFHHHRACYFPSPYVDPHGEKHTQFRGKPMTLDPGRFEELESLWLDHQFPQEVVGVRCTAPRVVIIDYY